MGHGFVRVATLPAAGALAIVAVLALGGCGTAPLDSAPSASQLHTDYKQAPAPLVKLFHEQNELLGGGAKAFARELRALRGYPVVVNKWASWCPDCRQEFSIFQRVAPRYARTVAFLGDDVNDGKGAAWLRKFPLSFPSYYDRSSAIDQALSPAAASYAPVTYFYDRAGKQVFFHFGPYLSVSSLEHDIRFYIGG